MTKNYLFTSVLFILMMTISCSSADDQHINPSEDEEIIHDGVELKDLKLGQRGAKQLNYDSDFPISFEVKLLDKTDRLLTVDVVLKDKETVLYNETFKEVTTMFSEHIIVLKDEKKFEDNKEYILELKVSTQKGVTKKIEEKVTFADFYIEKVEVGSYDSKNDYPNQIMINSNNNNLQYLDLHYNGTLQEVRYLFESKEDPTKIFYINLDPSDFKNDEENLVNLLVYKDNQYSKEGKEYSIIAGNYNLYLEYQTGDILKKPILIKEDIKIIDSPSIYDLNKLIIASDQTFVNAGKYTVNNNVLQFYVKGLKELMIENEEIVSIGLRIINKDNGTITASFQNLIFADEGVEALKENYVFSFELRNVISSFEAFIDIEYNNRLSESINYGKIELYEKK